VAQITPVFAAAQAGGARFAFYSDRRAQEATMDAEVLEILRGVEDPELGLSVVDLGLVYAAARGPDRIAVKMTATSRSCPSSEYLLEEARERLARAFPDIAVEVELVWSPAWTPERVSAAGRAELGI
jgi:metal-sulfur cluster biosynthetic enzyme